MKVLILFNFLLLFKLLGFYFTESPSFTCDFLLSSYVFLFSHFPRYSDTLLLSGSNSFLILIYPLAIFCFIQGQSSPFNYHLSSFIFHLSTVFIF